ncbi:mannan endo-1 [Scheffersomyces spartinae]|uniref:Mannan endo-1,6-alpha-mannosidase n=1 Tax=Scheffersomyces spartinae TaxID=45513 RepID=A0A9P7V5G8_9ASCO|nr:mannan endo-1 [Scheffersomyces spartinae]KAG7191736.1 mannan endo-1 [Scheffersomyces spartinae]
MAVSLDVADMNSICSAAKAVANGEWNYYEGLRKGGTVGMFQPPYYWWNAGEAFGGLLLYYSFCELDNSTLERIIYDGMYHQAGEDFNYIPANQSLVEGNDDQGVWGMTIMEAVERNFTDPPDHSWLLMTQAVYNTMNLRWDTLHCGGGLRWQIFTWNSGYDYKNTISNGCLFHIAARLGRYLGNDTYVETADKVYRWMEDVGFLHFQGDVLTLYDGAMITNNCSDPTIHKWSYSYGIFMAGCAYLYNATGDDIWLTRTQDIWSASSYFFNNSVLTETTCAPYHCNNDQRSFRCLFARCARLTMLLVPEMYDDIYKLMKTSAEAAAQSCSGGTDGVTCGLDWSVHGWDGVYGLGEQMSALETILSMVVGIKSVDSAPYTSTDGGSSASNPEAGLNTVDHTNQNQITVTGKDKAGAGIITAVCLGVILAGAVWMIL